MKEERCRLNPRTVVGNDKNQGQKGGSKTTAVCVVSVKEERCRLNPRTVVVDDKNQGRPKIK